MNASDIHRFARLGDLDALRQAAEAGIDVDAKDAFGSTPLHYAIAEKQVPAAELLLELEADVTLQDSNGKTALHYAVEHHLPAVLERLLKKNVPRRSRSATRTEISHCGRPHSTHGEITKWFQCCSAVEPAAQPGRIPDVWRCLGPHAALSQRHVARPSLRALNDLA
jgi:ankyrin repeat protein